MVYKTYLKNAEEIAYAQALAHFAEQIDSIAVLALGFPRQHGGLIAYADKIGAEQHFHA